MFWGVKLTAYGRVPGLARRLESEMVRLTPPMLPGMQGVASVELGLPWILGPLRLLAVRVGGVLLPIESHVHPRTSRAFGLIITASRPISPLNYSLPPSLSLICRSSSAASYDSASSQCVRTFLG